MRTHTYRNISIHHNARGRFYWWRGEDDAIVADTLDEAKAQIDAHLCGVRPVVASGTGAAL